MSEWQEVTLGELAKIKGGKRLPKGSQLSEEPSLHPYIRTTDISNHKIRVEELLFVPNDVFPSIKNYIVDAGDLIISIVGTIGSCAIIPSILDKANLTENCAKIVNVDERKLNKQFLYYYLVSEDGQAEIESRNVGSTQPKLPLYNIAGIPLVLPPLEEQKAIASVLSSLDDKIDLLHRQNTTLERMAETLFRQWFIEEAQEDWEEKSLLDLVELVGGGTPKTSVSEYWDGDIPWLSGGDIAINHKGFVTSSEKTITKAGLGNSSAKLLPKFATVISARGTVGKYCLLTSDMAFSQSNYGILPRIKNSYFFTYLLVNHIVAELQSAAYGSVFDTITTSTFRDATFSTPPTEKVLEFEGVIAKYFDKKLLNQTQIHTLEKLRDNLLPKLISGEVRVNH